MNTPTVTSKPHASEPSDDKPVQRFTSRELLKSGKRLEIEHNGQRYTLMITRNDKLILMK
jgi:hemin uptake protein HemP